MAGKSRGGHKNISRSKKRKVRKDFSPGESQQQATTQIQEPASQISAASVKVMTPKPKSISVAQPAYITTELRRIAILGGIMLAILVVLYLVIP